MLVLKKIFDYAYGMVWSGKTLFNDAGPDSN
jgi:hypothetical protein